MLGCVSYYHFQICVRLCTGVLRKPSPQLNKQRSQDLKGYVSDLPIGEVLVRAGLVSQNNIDDAVKDAGTRERLIGRTLVSRGLLTSEQLQAALQAQSLLRDGVVDSYKAFKALSHAGVSGLSFEEALSGLNADRVVKAFEHTSKLGELLEEAGVVSAQDLERAYHQSIGSGNPLGSVLVSEGLLTNSYVDAALELQIRVRDGMFSREQAVEALRQDPRKLLELIAPFLMAPQGAAGEIEQSAKASAKAKPVRLGELFVRAGILTQADVAQALELALAHSHPIGEMLVARAFITRALLDAALSLQRMVTDHKLTTGEATACLVKVFNTDKTLSECLLELNLVKAQAVPGKSQAEICKVNDSVPGYFKRPVRNASRTINELPAMMPQRPITLKDLNLDLMAQKVAAETDLDQSAAVYGAISPESTALLDVKFEDDLKAQEPTPPLTTFADLFPQSYNFVATDKTEFFSGLHGAFSRLGRIYLKRGDFLAAEELLEDALSVSQSFHLDYNLISDMSFLACLHLKTGKSWQAEKILKRCLVLIAQLPGNSDVLTGVTYHRLALAYCHLGLLFKAEKHFKRAVELIQNASLTGYLLLGAASEPRGQGPNSTTSRLLKRRLAAIYKDHAVLLNRMRRESEADKYYFLARKTLSSSMGMG